MNINKFTISGFKSFANTTEIEFLDGITGIIGTNGAGKSNLVEAVLWALGEEYQQTEDQNEILQNEILQNEILFAGNGEINSRNNAEVSLCFFNPETKQDEKQQIKITRKLICNQRPVYTINEADVTDKDVQNILLDQNIDPQAVAFVKQNKINDIILHKNYKIKQIIYEAAGVKGLKARKKYAMAKLLASKKSIEKLELFLQKHQNKIYDIKEKADLQKQYDEIYCKINALNIIDIANKIKQSNYKRKIYKHKIKQMNHIVQQNDNDIENNFLEITKTKKNIQIFRQKEIDANEQNQSLAIKMGKNTVGMKNKKFQLAYLGNNINFYQNEIENNQKWIEQTFDKSQLIQHIIKNCEKDKQREFIQIEQIKQKISKIEKVILTKKNLTQEIKIQIEKKQKEFLQAQKNQTIDEEYKKRIKEFQNEYEKNFHNNLEKHKKYLVNIEKNYLQIQKKLKIQIQEKDNLEKQVNTEKIYLKEKFEQTQKLQIQIEVDKTKIKILESLVKNNTLENNTLENNTLENNTLAENLLIKKGFEKAVAAAIGDAASANIDFEQGTSIFWQKKKGNYGKNQFLFDANTLDQIVKVDENAKKLFESTAWVNDWETGQKLAQKLQPGQNIVSIKGDFWRWDGLTITCKHHNYAIQNIVIKNQINKTKENLKKQCTQYQEKQKYYQNLVKQLEQKYLQLQKKHAAIDENNKYKNDIQKQIQIIQKQIQTNIKQKKQKQIQIQEYQNKINDKQNNQKHFNVKTEQIDTEKIDPEQIDPSVKIEQLNIQIKNLEIEKINFDNDRKNLQNQIRNIEDNIKNNQKEAVEWEKRNQQAELQNIELQKNLQYSQKLCLQIIEDSQEQNTDIIQQNFAENKKLYQKINSILEKFQNKYNRQIINNEKLIIKNEQLKKHRNNIKQNNEQNLEQINPQFQNIIDKIQQFQNIVAETQSQNEKQAENLYNVEPDENDIERIIKNAENVIYQKFPDWKNIDQNEIPSIIQELQMQNDNEIKKYNAKHSQDEQYQKHEQYQKYEQYQKQISQYQEQINDVKIQKNQLDNAVEKFYAAIKNVNLKSEQQTKKAIEQLQEHFNHLISEIFSGAKAQIKFKQKNQNKTNIDIQIELEDKNIQYIEQLSEGEKTLTIIALIFARFLVNPPPMCILDEVDAPLDDNYTKKFCDLLNYMKENIDTKFLIVTHNRYTIANMDRIYEVAMSEKGYSEILIPKVRKKTSSRQENHKMKNIVKR